MATQGLVTIVKDGHVAMKFIAGSDGMNAIVLEREIRKLGRVPSLVEGYELALGADFGSEDSLVVMGIEGIETQAPEELHERYRATFQDPRFNPRWESGTADYVKIVRL
jgi:hypothetical protein